MKKILSCKMCIDSAIKLRNAIGEQTGKHFVVSKQADLIDKEGCLIRYGNGRELKPGIPDTEYNPSKFIGLSSNKYFFSELMKKMNIPSPEFFMEGEPGRFPVLIRETLTGSGGEGIIPVKTLEEFHLAFNPGHDWWTPYVKTQYEVRAYVIGGQITDVFYKVPFKNQEQDEIRIRSEYHFSHAVIGERFKKLKHISGQIYEELGGKFFSLDAGWNIERGYVVFESNTGSWMNNSIASKLAKYLVAELKIA